MLGVHLPGTLIFDYPTISSMSTMLAAKLLPNEAAPVSVPPSRYKHDYLCGNHCALTLSQNQHIFHLPASIKMCHIDMMLPFA